MLNSNYIGKALNNFKDFKSGERYFILNEEPDYYDVCLEDYFSKNKVRIYKTRITFLKEKVVTLTEEEVKNHLNGTKYSRVLSNLGYLPLVKVPKVNITVDDFRSFLMMFEGENSFSLKKTFHSYREIFYLCVKNARFLEDSFFEGRDLDFAQDIDLICAYIGGLTTNSFSDILFQKYVDFAEILSAYEQSILNRYLPKEERIYSEFEIFFFKLLIECYSENLVLNDRNKELLSYLITKPELLKDRFTKFYIAKLYLGNNSWLEKDLKIAYKYFEDCLALGILDSYLYLGLIEEKLSREDPKLLKKAIKSYMMGSASGIEMCKLKVLDLTKNNNIGKKVLFTSEDLLLEAIEDLKKEIEKSKFENPFPESVIMFANICKENKTFDQYKEQLKIYLFQAKYCLENRHHFRHNIESKASLLEKIESFLKEFNFDTYNGKIVKICSDIDIKYLLNSLSGKEKTLGLSVIKTDKNNLNFQLFNISGENKLLTGHSTDFVLLNSFITVSTVLEPKMTKRRQLEEIKKMELCDSLSLLDEVVDEHPIKKLLFKKNDKVISQIYLKDLFVELD